MTNMTERKFATTEGERLGFLHIPYVFGGITTAGMDCSGLVSAAWKVGQHDLPHNSAQQAQWFRKRGKLVPWTPGNAAKMKPGDVIFYQGDGGITPEDLGHCAMFLRVFEHMHIVAQATQPGVGTEVIRAQKYEKPLFIGYM